MTVRHYKTIDSTNDEAMRLIDAAYKNNTISSLNECIIVSDEQTAGHGRLDRVFNSPRGGLYFSLIYLGEVLSPAVITASAAVCVSDALIKRGYEARIKWVNDVLIKGVKVCGILTKGVLSPKGVLSGAVIGIGVDMLDDTLLFDIATPLLKIIGDSNKISETMARYKALSMLLGETVTVNTLAGEDNNKNGERNIYRATVLDITDEALLVVKSENGVVKHLSSGEVTLHSLVN